MASCSAHPAPSPDRGRYHRGNGVGTTTTNGSAESSGHGSGQSQATRHRRRPPEHLEAPTGEAAGEAAGGSRRRRGTGTLGGTSAPILPEPPALVVPPHGFLHFPFVPYLCQGAPGEGRGVRVVVVGPNLRSSPGFRLTGGHGGRTERADAVGTGRMGTGNGALRLLWRPRRSRLPPGPPVWHNLFPFNAARSSIVTPAVCPSLPGTGYLALGSNH